MKSFAQVRILHLSDLHFGRNHICRPRQEGAATLGIPTLAKLIRNDLSNPTWETVIWSREKAGAKTPLLVALTGDLTQKAEVNEFDEASEFITDLTKGELLGTHVSLKDILVVPGNHDVEFQYSDPAHRFARYCSFYNALFASIQPNIRNFARSGEAHSISQIRQFPADRVLVLEVNSCFYVEKETQDESRGQIDQATITTLRSQLAKLPSDAKQWIKVALVHHHPVLMPSFVESGRGVDSILNARSLLNLLRDHGFQVILHGHKHYPQVFSYDPDSAWSTAEASLPQIVIAGGSIASTSLPEAKEKCNTYNLITIKWNPDALQARIQVVTRGLKRLDSDGELDFDRWEWSTLRVFDKVLSPYENTPLPGQVSTIPKPVPRDTMDDHRFNQYQNLRYNMPVVEVLPSLMPGQGYEAKVWLVPHRPGIDHKEYPKKVTWCAGQSFSHRKICDRIASGRNAATEFCTTFHYWGPTLIQAILEFDDGVVQTGYVYARLPDSIIRR